MKARILIGNVAAAIRPGWRPDAYAIFNVSNRNVYVIEGATDPGVGANDYSFIVRPGGSLTMPTVSDNFSAIQDAGADVPVPFLIWTKDEVSPSYNVGGGGGGGTEGSGAVVFGDASGTGDGADHVALAASLDRRYVLAQNPSGSGSSFWIDFGTPAVAASPSVEVVPGVTLTFDGSALPSNDIHVLAPIGLKYTIKGG